MPKVAEPDLQQRDSIDPSGCDRSALVLPRPALPDVRTRMVPYSGASVNDADDTAPASADWLKRGARAAYRGLKRLIPDEIFLWLNHRRHVGRFPNLTEPQTFNGRIAPDGTVSITYNLIGTQMYVGQHFTAILTGSLAGGVLAAKGRAGASGRDFSVRVQCR